MKMTSIAILVTPVLVLAGTAIAVMLDAGKAGIANPGAHGFSEILYAFSSAANNNGSAFAGLSANTPFYNTMLAIAMWFGRFAVIVPVLAIAGVARRQAAPGSRTPGTMPTHGPMFVGLLVGVVLLVGVLNYVPALALGPVVEHLQLYHRSNDSWPPESTMSQAQTHAAGSHATQDADAVRCQPDRAGDRSTRSGSSTRAPSRAARSCSSSMSAASSPRCCICSRWPARGEAPAGFILAIAVWLWFTVLFANFAEALAEGPQQGPGRIAARPEDRPSWPRSWPRRNMAPPGCRRRPPTCARAIRSWSKRAT